MANLSQGITVASTLLFVVLLVAPVFGGPNITWKNDYRIDVYFDTLENPGSLEADGTYCDKWTRCDPRVRYELQLNSKQAHKAFPDFGETPFYTELIIAENADKLTLHKLVQKNICDAAEIPIVVSIRVRVTDQDFWTRDDLIETFDCSFDFKPTPRDEMRWSSLSSCLPFYQPQNNRLTFQWRIVPIHSAECSYHGPLSPIARTTTTSTTTTTTTAPTTTTTTTTEPSTSTTTIVIEDTTVETESEIQTEFETETEISAPANTPEELPRLGNETANLVEDQESDITRSSDPDPEGGDVVYDNEEYPEGGNEDLSEIPSQPVAN